MNAIFLRDTAGHPERQDNNILPARITNHCIVFGSSWLLTKPGGGGGTPLLGLYGNVPLDRVWFFGLAVLNRVYNLTCLCPKQGQLS